jgi:hypothetical protein
MSSRVVPGQQDGWLDNDVDEADAFDDPRWEAIDPGPVLGREQAAQWLERRDQRLEAARMRLTGSTLPRPRPPVVHVPQRREPERRPRKRRARSRSTAPTRGPPDDSGELPHRLTADERRALKEKVDARRRELVAAPEQADKVERSLERHWREDAA